MNAPTKRQSEILSLIATFTQTRGYPPSYRELMQLLGLSSPATLHKHINNLKANGHLQDLPRGWRKLKTAKGPKQAAKLYNEIAIIGTVSRGQKIELFAKSTLFALPESLVSSGRTLYGLVVKDHSFLHLHMLQGDLLIVEASKQALKARETVLVQSKSDGVQILRYPEEMAHAENASLQGVIVTLFRKYQGDSSSDSGSKSSKD